MSDATLADKFDVDEVYRTKRTQVIHLSDDCNGINDGTKTMPSDPAAIPVGYYDLCQHCDPDQKVPAGGRADEEGWPV